MPGKIHLANTAAFASLRQVQAILDDSEQLELEFYFGCPVVTSQKIRKDWNIVNFQTPIFINYGFFSVLGRGILPDIQIMVRTIPDRYVDDLKVI